MVKRRIFALGRRLGLFLLTAAAVGADTITVSPGFVQASSPGARSVFEESLETAVASAGRASEAHDYRLAAPSRGSTPGTGSTPGGPTITIVANESPQERYIVLSADEGPAAGTSLLIRAPWDQVLGPVLTQALRYFEPAFFGYPEDAVDDAEAGIGPVRFVDELPLESLRPPSPAHALLGLYPMGLAVLPTGNVVVAGSTFAVEVDSLFRVASFPGIGLLDEGNYGYARAVGTTPAGTIYLQPAQGTDIYRIVPGAPAPQRIRRAAGGFGPLVVLPDGSVVTIDAVSKRAFRIAGRERREFPLFSHPDAYISTAVSGPAGNIWSFDAVERRIQIHSPEGRLVDSIIPAVPPAAASQTVGMAPYQDGSFLLLTREGLWKIARDGQPIWTISTLPDGRRTTFTQVVGVAVDSERGFVYIADSQRRSLARLHDASGAEAVPAEAHERLANLNAHLGAEGEDARILAAKARLYSELGAAVLAEATWRYVLDIDPFNDEARSGLEETEFARLLSQAGQIDRRARETLSRIGPASAQADYLQALQLYEQILTVRPDSRKARDEMEALRRHFAEGGQDGGRSLNPLLLESVVMDNVFPSMFSTYRSRPVGTVRVTNRGEAPLSDVRAELTLRRYSDFPAVSELPGTILPGESRDIPLRLILNTDVFEVEEDLPIQASVTVRATAGSTQHSTERSHAFTLHRRTALNWIETERLGAFITPNESNISRFALFAGRAGEVAGEAPGSAGGTRNNRSFSRSFLRAARIIDTLGLYGISYVEDPITPISAILGRTDIVDTVRLPRTTLLNRAGDCDDTSALLASLLEAAGIPTAIVTTPDHVLVALDTGEPRANAWIYGSAGIEVFEHNDSLWLPVETTVVEEGFVATLEAASRRIRSAGGVDSVGFVTTDSARRQYPTIPVPPTQINLALPAEPTIGQRVRITSDELVRIIYEEALAAVEAGAGGPARAADLIRMGSLHSRFGRAEEALKSFEAALTADAISPLPRVHYATHLLALERPDRAIEVLEPAAERYPETMLIRALLARSYLDAGRGREAVNHVDIVNRRAPALAQRYAIVDRDGGTRASDGFDPAAAALPIDESEL